jgi:CRISPR-associated protein (TIGR02584 family)
MNSQSTHHEHILLCVSGMTPAIITETFYYLAKLRTPIFVPDRVIVVTTGGGKEKIKEELFDKPRFQEMCQQNNWPATCFQMSDVFAVHDANGVLLHDIRTPEQFNDFADLLMQQVKKLVDPKRDSPCIIHASLAGGRKTMSYYMGQVMSIFGRPTDFLSHVLVSDTFERPGLNFYYPHQEETLQIINRDKTFSHFDGSAHDSDILNLSEFPVLPVSSQANLSRFLHSGLRFNQILDAARDELNAVVKPIEYSYGTSNIDVSFGYDRLSLTPKELSYLLWLGWRDRKKMPPIEPSLPGKLSSQAQKAQAECIEHYYCELRLLNYFVRESGDAFEIEECSSEKWTKFSSEQLSYIRTDLSRLQEKLTGISHVYRLTVWKNKEPRVKKESLPSMGKPKKSTASTTKAIKQIVPAPAILVPIKGQFKAPSGLLRDDDFIKIDAYMTQHLSEVTQLMATKTHTF